MKTLRITLLGLVLALLAGCLTQERGYVAFAKLKNGMTETELQSVLGAPTEITTDARTHYHNRLTETYYILQCEADARMALDGKIIPVKPGMCILIRPGVRHRAIGRMTVLIVVFPKFDPDDEVIVEEPSVTMP